MLISVRFGQISHLIKINYLSGHVIIAYNVNNKAENIRPTLSISEI